MDPQLQELAREIADAVEKRLSGQVDAVEKRLSSQADAVEKRLSGHIDSRLKDAFGNFESGIKEHIDKFEQRAETRMKMHFENLEGQVKLAAEGYGATPDGIERRLTEINTKFDTKFGDHDRILADHNTRITTVEKRP